MKNSIASLISVTLGLMSSSTNVTVSGLRGGATHELSATQARMHAARLADAPRRNALAAEIKVWNRGVKRRNQRFVARQIARGRSA